MSIEEDSGATHEKREINSDEQLCPQCDGIVKKSSEISPKCRTRLLNPPYLELDIHNENFMI